MKSTRPRSRMALALPLAVCLAAYSIAGAFHDHDLQVASPQVHASGEAELHGAAAGPCLACRASQQQVPVSEAALSAPRASETPRTLPLIRMRLPRPETLPSRSPRAPPVPTAIKY